jgi:hypothetical protein
LILSQNQSSKQLVSIEKWLLPLSAQLVPIGNFVGFSCVFRWELATFAPKNRSTGTLS